MKLKKEYTLEEISQKYNCKIKGDKKTIINSVCSLLKSKKGAISYLADKQYISLLKESSVSCVISTAMFAEEIIQPVLISENPLLVFSQLICESYNSTNNSLFLLNNENNSHISKKAIIGKNVILGNNIKIGDNSIIFPNVVIYDNTIIGENVIIHSGSIIGSDGFGLVVDELKQWQKVPQIGNVVIHDNVEIGANTTIDRASIDSTILYDNVKIDNHVHVAHNVTIGENTAIAACVGIAGSTSIGRNCTIGGGAGINGHIKIVDDVHIHGMTMVTKNLTEPGQYASGTTVEKAASWRKNQARFKNLDELAKIIKKDNGEKDE